MLSGTMSMYLGEPPERVDVPVGGAVTSTRARSSRRSTTARDDLLVYAYGTPPEDEHAELLDSAV